MDIRTGCSGWNYSQWVGPFYPRGTKPSDYLKVYSRIFDIVEIDSSFYRIPDAIIVESWRNSTPEGFLFTAKMPQSVTHDLRLRNASREASSFVERIGILKNKIACILIQLPPSLSYKEGFPRLKTFLEDLPPGFSYAIEFRHDSWFRDDMF
ncbi:MAG: DUF72 domain-containing protein, partial [Thermoplasmata archaeon]